MTQSSQFQPRQILCLEQGQSRLYAEVIQVVADRPVCWLRPLVLEVMATEQSRSMPTELVEEEAVIGTGMVSALSDRPQKQPIQPQPKTYDLRLSSDLLMPPALFRHAFDTELIPLLDQINSTEFNLVEAQTAHQLLRDFIQQVWQNHREVFPS